MGLLVQFRRDARCGPLHLTLGESRTVALSLKGHLKRKEVRFCVLQNWATSYRICAKYDADQMLKLMFSTLMFMTANLAWSRSNGRFLDL